MGPEELKITSRIVVILWGTRACVPLRATVLIGLRRRADIKPAKPGHFPRSPSPSPRAPLLPPSALRPLLECPLTYTKPSAYRGVPPTIKVCLTLVPGLVPPLNTLVCLQSEKPTRNGPYKHTQIVFQKSRKKPQEMSSERSLLSMHPLCNVAHSRSVLGQ